MNSMSMRRRRPLFHSLFGSTVPLEESLLQVYRCALQKDILVQGHMYVSEHHVCFKANIFGWVTRIALPFADIVAIEKRNTARVIPNGIRIVSTHTKHVFASFLSRDDAYALLTDLWQKHRTERRQNENEHDDDDGQPHGTDASHSTTIAAIPSKDSIALPTPPPSPSSAASSHHSSPPPQPPPPPPLTTTVTKACGLFQPGRWRPMLALLPTGPPTQDNHRRDKEHGADNNNDHQDPNGVVCLLTLTLVLIITQMFTIYHLEQASRHLAVIESLCK